MTTHPLPAVLFGAFDRHNFGDLLFPHVAARLLAARDDCAVQMAGLAARDLRAQGGHRVTPLVQLRDVAFDLIHVGGEILSCDAWDAAVMLQTPADAQRIIASQRHARLEWAQRVLGMRDLAPYVASRYTVPGAAHVVFHAVGGVELDQRPGALRDEVLARLASADAVSVRDVHTQRLLAKSGIDARLAPDNALLVAELFGDTIREHAARGAVARIREAAPQGYLAVQFNATFGDDATLTRIAAQLDHIADAHDLAVVFFRAGAAPWHDDLSCLRRTAARMRAPRVQVFDSLNIWDICALIEGSRAYLGSSLHGRIIAMAYALPRVNLLHDEDFARPCKQLAFAETWEVAIPTRAFNATHAPAAVRVGEIADGIDAALSVPSARLARLAVRLATLCRDAFQTVVQVTG
jgi:hypothetical protein